jgi:hypothetical protein
MGDENKGAMEGAELGTVMMLLMRTALIRSERGRRVLNPNPPSPSSKP